MNHVIGELVYRPVRFLGKVDSWIIAELKGRLIQYLRRRKNSDTKPNAAHGGRNFYRGFKSGKLICTGGRSPGEALKALRRIHKILVYAGAAPPNSRLKFEVRNIVASATLPGAFIDVEKASKELPGAVYIPEQFPAARYKPQGVNVSFLLYSSGKIICAGAKSVEELVEAVDVLHEQLEEYNLLIHP